MMRLFIAIDLPEFSKDALEHLRVPLPNARWTGREALHLTLQFLGDGISDAHLAGICAALHSIEAAAFTLALRGVGQFPGGQKPARVLWAGVDAPPGLYSLAGQVHQAMSAIGFPPDSRPFSPHVTLARLRHPLPASELDGFLAQGRAFMTVPFTVAAIVLYASQLTASGPVYTEQARQALH